LGIWTRNIDYIRFKGATNCFFHQESNPELSKHPQHFFPFTAKSRHFPAKDLVVKNDW
jgi:hypothetical protein